MSIGETLTHFFDQHFPNHSTSIYRDLLMNVKKVLEDSPLEPADRFLGLAAIATSLDHKPLFELAAQHLKTLEVSDEQIQEAKESAAIMGMLNTYYKFKGYLAPDSVENYQRAGLRMQSLSKPLNGKERFEMMSFAVSVVNGCPTCVSSHEKALRALNVDAEKIHDLARLASATKGLTVLHKNL
jgi:alkyl hydroperoxide reductase subunit D